jgi:hypothetical protein
MQSHSLCRWIPGTPPSNEAIERMRSRFSRPTAPMGEAWFLGKERKMFDCLMTKRVPELSVKYLDECLYEITSGVTCFGNRDTWAEWFRYLLSDLILRAHEQQYVGNNYLLENTISAFMAIFPQGMETEYREFQQDIIDTLSRSLMKPEFWTPHPDFPLDPLKRLPQFLLAENDGEIFVDFYGFTKAQPALSAALFFCLKYLAAADIPSWVDSILRIEHSQWRAGLLIWLLGFKQLLPFEPLTPAAVELARPEIYWQDSHCLGEEQGDRFINSANIQTFVYEFRARLTPVMLDQWESQLSDDHRVGGLPGFDQMMKQVRGGIA